MPTPLVAVPSFGGPDHDILFVATGSEVYDFYTNVVGETLDDGSAGNLFVLPGLGSGKPPRLPTVEEAGLA